jgi:N-acetylglucosaminyl-diphospho-decaprenol L-rhamnosyltransferase
MNSHTHQLEDRDDRVLNDVTVIFVAFNSAHLIAQTLAPLTRCAHVIVVDNGSDDDTVAVIERDQPQVKIIKNPTNVGFGVANNQAMRASITRYCMLINPDCEPRVEDISALQAVAQTYPECSIVAPEIITKAGHPEVSYHLPFNIKDKTTPAAEGECCVSFVTGAAMFVDREKILAQGGFDPAFFLYYEDADLSLRMYKTKQSVIVAPQVKIVHRSRSSVRGNRLLFNEYLRGFHHAQSKIIYARKHEPAKARKLRMRTLALAAMSLPLRIFAPVPRYVARHVGRIAGLVKLR